jgi:hypothetical protein
MTLATTVIKNVGMIPEQHAPESPHTRFRDLARCHDLGRSHPKIRIQVSGSTRSTLITGLRRRPSPRSSLCNRLRAELSYSRPSSRLPAASASRGGAWGRVVRPRRGVRTPTSCHRGARCTRQPGDGSSKVLDPGFEPLRWAIDGAEPVLRTPAMGHRRANSPCDGPSKGLVAVREARRWAIDGVRVTGSNHAEPCGPRWARRDPSPCHRGDLGVVPSWEPPT